MSYIRKHFHTFDALRFFSFLLVFLHHIPHTDSPILNFFTRSGGVGVSFFFVLSGFLITYILLEEKIANGQISLKKFFARRILRIWPLFYAMILFAFLTPHVLEFLNLSYSNEGYKPNWVMSMLFLENYKMMFTGSFPNVSPLNVMWSLCIEEHFYIIWGLAFYFIPIKKVPALIVSCLLLASVSRAIYGHYGLPDADVFSNLDYFAFGAIPAYLLLFKGEFINRIGKISLSVKYTFALVTLTVAFGISSLKWDGMFYLTPLLCGLFFSTLILLTLPSLNPIYIKDKTLVSKLGIYTYGLYLFHTIIINFLLQAKQMLPFEVNWVVLAIAALVLTILISMASYHLFEKPFLKLKKYVY